jgi:hypothetical protein
MSEIFDHIETCDRQTFGSAAMGRAEGSIKNISDPDAAKNIAYMVWKNSLNMVNVPGTVADKYETHPQYPKMMMELTYEMEKQQGLYITYIEEELYLHTDADANIDKRNAAMSAVTSLVGKPNLLAKSETMILMQNGKAVSGTFMENAVGKDAFHLSEDDPMREYDGDVYDNHEVFADIAAMQALDYICGNIDRHEGNMFYQFGDVNGKTKLIGITGIDNDLSFGLTPATTKKNVGNVWIQPEQFGVLDAATAQRILAIEKSTLQSTLSGYRLSLKEINAAWERTAHLQEKIIEGLEHFKNKKPCLFMNRVIYGTKNDANMIQSVIGWLQKLEPSVDVQFKNYSQFADLVLDIFEEVADAVELDVEYDPNAFNSISIEEVFDAE